jgi:hypothetical protein
MSDENSGGGELFMLIAGIYLFISQPMALYFWWEYAQDNNFASSLFIGPFVGELKGMLWVFFI